MRTVRNVALLLAAALIGMANARDNNRLLTAPWPQAEIRQLDGAANLLHRSPVSSRRPIICSTQASFPPPTRCKWGLRPPRDSFEIQAARRHRVAP